MRLRARIRLQEGMTIVEVLVGAFLLAVGLGAAVAAFPFPGKQTLTAQREVTAAGIAEREIEAMRQLPFANLAVTTMPTTSGNGLIAGDHTTTNPRNPDYYVNNGRLRIKSKFHDETSANLPESPGAGEPIVVNASGVPHTSTTTVGGVDYTVYRYVTQRQELCPINFGSTVLNAVSNLITGLLGSLLGTVNSVIPANVNVLCTGTNAERRVIVAVVAARTGNRAGLTRPVYLSTVIAHPTLGLTGLAG